MRPGSGVLAHALSEVALPSASGRWSDLGVRVASAVVLGPVALFCIWDGGLAWELFICTALAGLGGEWARLAVLQGQRGRRFVFGGGLIAVAVIALAGGWLAGFAALAILTLAVAIDAGRFAAAGLPYAALGGFALLWLRLEPRFGLLDTMFLVFVVWGTDIGAYVVGRVLGGKKLAPRISPGKTWSGSIGGLAIGGLAGALLAGGFHGLDLAALPAALLLSVAAQAGDLLESAIKRKLGVKDSGRTIPGHGGLFDRLDGFLAAAPMAAILALSVQGGVPLWG